MFKMTSEQVKSLVRHLITAFGMVVSVFGITSLNGFADLLQENFDPIVQAITVVVGFVISVIGFFQNKNRFVERS